MSSWCRPLVKEATPKEIIKRKSNLKIFTNDEVAQLRSHTNLKDLGSQTRTSLSFVCFDPSHFAEQLQIEENKQKEQEENEEKEIDEQNKEDENNLADTMSDIPSENTTQESNRTAKITQNTNSFKPINVSRGRMRTRGATPSEHRKLMASDTRPKKKQPPTKFAASRSLGTVIKKGKIPLALLAKKPTSNLPKPPPGYDFVPSLGYYLPTKEARESIQKEENEENEDQENVTVTRKTSIPTKLSNSAILTNVEQQTTASPKGKGPLEELIMTEREFVRDMSAIVVDVCTIYYYISYLFH